MTKHLKPLVIAATLAAVCSGASAPATQAADNCPNAATRVGPSKALSVCRAYELVSPPAIGTHVAGVFSPTPMVQTWNAVAADGTGVLWTTRVALPGIDSSGRTDVYLARRGTSQWASTYVGPPGTKMFPTYDNFAPASLWASTDLDHVLWQVFGATIDPADHDVTDPTDEATKSYSDVYRRDSDGRFTRITQGSQAPAVPQETTRIVGVSPDAQTVVFESDRQLEPGAVPGPNLYLRRNGITTLVSTDETGVALSLPEGYGSSDDGNVVVFHPQGNPNELYVRSGGSGGLPRTVHLHAADPSGRGFNFESLSADGRKLFVLTADAVTGDDADTSIDLLEYDTATDTFSRLSKRDGAAGAGPGNSDACGTPLPRAGQCDVSAVAVSRDGSKAYFVSPERLDGTKGIDGGVNLYLAEGGTVRFVATLDADDPDFGGAPGSAFQTPLGRRVRLLPDGSKLLFESRARLTSYDNADHVEIYLHDSVKATVVCVSCRPDRTPPVGDASLRNADRSGKQQFSEEPMYPLNADERGDRIFFMSTDRIVPQDLNARFDVYEHDVATGTTTLISSGISANDSAYLGNGLDGKDVFFFTTDSLVPQDRNGNVFKLYDARVGGGFPAPSEPSPPCSGEGCRGPVASAPGAAQIGTGLTGAPAAAERAPRSRLSVLGSRLVTGASGRLLARVSGRGRLRVSGRGLVRATVTTTKAGRYWVTLRLSRHGRATLRRMHRLSVRVTLRFVPSAGATRSARVKMTFTSMSKKGRG
jgi:hypothetical protein